MHTGCHCNPENTALTHKLIFASKQYHVYDIKGRGSHATCESQEITVGTERSETKNSKTDVFDVVTTHISKKKKLKAIFFTLKMWFSPYSVVRCSGVPMAKAVPQTKFSASISQTSKIPKLMFLVLQPLRII